MLETLLDRTSTSAASPSTTPSAKPSPAAAPTLSLVRQHIRNFLHDTTTIPATTIWYNALLNRLPENSHVLVVGIANGTPLIQNARILTAKQISVVGIDTDPDYITHCLRNVKKHALNAVIKPRRASLTNFKPPNGRLFTHIYFNGDFMQPARNLEDLLRRCVDLLIDREDGRIFFTQQFQLEKSHLLEWIKPALTSFTTVPFGPVLYLDDFEESLYASGLVVVDTEHLHDGLHVPNVRQSRLVETRSNLYVKPLKETLN